jgi:hypothetical protein
MLCKFTACTVTQLGPQMLCKFTACTVTQLGPQMLCKFIACIVKQLGPQMLCKFTACTVTQLGLRSDTQVQINFNVRILLPFLMSPLVQNFHFLM